MHRIYTGSVIVFLNMLLSLTTHATIPGEQTFGLYDAVLDGYKHLSPTHGFVASEQNTFDGYYHYTQPSEPLYKLMHILFRFVDTLVPHVSDSAVGTHLDAAMIGKLLAAIEKNLDRGTGIIQIPKDELKKQLLEILNQTGTRMKQKTKVGPREDFAQILVDALDEAGHWDPNGKHYPQFLVHDMLLTLLFKKVNNKPEYKNYFDQFKALNNSDGILKPNAIDLLNKSYEDPNDPASMAKNIKAILPLEGNIHSILTIALTHYESLAYAAIKLSSVMSHYPSQAFFRSTILSWYLESPLLKQAPDLISQYRFTDCMETAIRNLFIFTEYDSTTNNFKGTISYFKQFDPQAITSQNAHTIWADLVSDIPHAKYNKRVKLEKSPEGKLYFILETAKIDNKDIPWDRPSQSDEWYYYELEPTLTNIVLVANKLFGLQLKSFSDFLKHFNLECPSYIGTEKKEDICKITDQNKKTCTLNYKPSHALIEPYPQEISFALMAEIIAKDLPSWTSSHFLPLINLYSVDLLTIKTENTGLQTKLIQSPYLRHALLIQNFASSDVKLVITDLVLALGKLSEIKSSSWYRSLIMKLIDELLALNNAYLANQVFTQMALYGYAWQIIPEFIQRFNTKSFLLNGDHLKYILRFLSNNAPPEYTTQITTFISQIFNQQNSGDTQYSILEGIKNNVSLYQSLLPSFFSEKNIKQQNNPIYMIDLLVSSGQTTGIKAENAQEIIKKLMPAIEKSPEDIEGIIKRIIRAHSYIGNTFSKEIILRLIPLIEEWQAKAIIKKLDANLWGENFINQLRIAIKK